MGGQVLLQCAVAGCCCRVLLQGAAAGCDSDLRRVLLLEAVTRTQTLVQAYYFAPGGVLVDLLNVPPGRWCEGLLQGAFAGCCCREAFDAVRALTVVGISQAKLPCKPQKQNIAHDTFFLRRAAAERRHGDLCNPFMRASALYQRPAAACPATKPARACRSVLQRARRPFASGPVAGPCRSNAVLALLVAVKVLFCILAVGLPGAYSFCLFCVACSAMRLDGDWCGMLLTVAET